MNRNFGYSPSERGGKITAPGPGTPPPPPPPPPPAGLPLLPRRGEVELRGLLVAVNFREEGPVVGPSFLLEDVLCCGSLDGGAVAALHEETQRLHRRVFVIRALAAPDQAWLHLLQEEEGRLLLVALGGPGARGGEVGPRGRRPGLELGEVLLVGLHLLLVALPGLGGHLLRRGLLRRRGRAPPLRQRLGHLRGLRSRRQRPRHPA